MKLKNKITKYTQASLHSIIAPLFESRENASEENSESSSSLKEQLEALNTKFTKKINRCIKKLSAATSELEVLESQATSHIEVISSKVPSKLHVTSLVVLKSTSTNLRSVFESLSQMQSTSPFNLKSLTSTHASLASEISEHNAKVSEFNSKCRIKEILRRIAEVDITKSVFSQIEEYYDGNNSPYSNPYRAIRKIHFYAARGNRNTTRTRTRSTCCDSYCRRGGGRER